MALLCFMNRKRVLAIKQNKACFQHGVSNTTEELSFEPVISTKQNMRDFHGTWCFSGKKISGFHRTGGQVSSENGASKTERCIWVTMLAK